MQFDPSNSSAWIKYAELESQLGDYARTRAIFELGVSQSPLSMPEILWKAYIDFETDEGEREAARALYERLIGLSGHFKVWIAYAKFEAEAIPVPRALRDEEDEDEEDAEVKVVAGDPTLARAVFERSYKDLKSKGLKSEVGGWSFSSSICLMQSLCSAYNFLRNGRPSKWRMALPMMLRRYKG